MLAASFSGGNHIELDFNQSWKVWTTDQSTGAVNMKTLCLQDSCFLFFFCRYLQVFKVASDPWVGTESEPEFMSMQGHREARVSSFAMTGHLVMVGQEHMSVALEQVNASLQ